MSYFNFYSRNFQPQKILLRSQSQRYNMPQIFQRFIPFMQTRILSSLKQVLFYTKNAKAGYLDSSLDVMASHATTSSTRSKV